MDASSSARALEPRVYLCIGGASGRLMVPEPELAGEFAVYSGGAALNCTTLLLFSFWNWNFRFAIAFAWGGGFGLNLGGVLGLGLNECTTVLRCMEMGLF